MFLGLDLSLTNSGVCLVDAAGKILQIGSVHTEPAGDLISQRFSRYWTIVEEISKFFSNPKFQISLAAIEHYSYASRGKTIQLVELGTLVRDSLLVKFPVIEVAPVQLKKFLLGTGKGKSLKNVMCREVYKKYGVNIDDDNQVDAFVLTQVARLYFYVKNGRKVKARKYQREVVETILKKELEVRT